EVRNAAAGKVTKFSRILGLELAIQHILPCVKELSSYSFQHDMSALASVIMGMAPVLGKDATRSSKPGDLNRSFVPIFTACNCRTGLRQTLENYLVIHRLMTDFDLAYVRLLRDNEAEVRNAAAGKVTKFSRILGLELAIQHILPCVKELSSYSSQHDRSTLASVIMGMAPVLGKAYVGILGSLELASAGVSILISISIRM
nr:serine/threonine-protein phosphatase 2A 65 kDa regulatory subunit A beta isoform-like [Tanacetum cinerariifolium]